MTAAVAHTPLDLRQSGSYPIRLGASISQPTDGQRWGNVRYNYTPTLGNQSSATARISPARDGDSSHLSIKDGKDEYRYDGDTLDEEDSYVLICHGEGKEREWTLERLGATHQFNIISTPGTKDAEKLADRYPHLLPGTTLGEDGDDGVFGGDTDSENGDADANNPFDFRHFLKEEALKPQEATRSTAGTPSLAPARAAASTPVPRPAKKVSAFAPAQKKRKAPAAGKAAPTKRAKAKAESVQDELAEEEVQKPAPKKAASKPSRRDSVPQIRVERKASTRKASFDDQEDSGDLIIEDDDVPAPKQTRSAMSLALHGHLGTGPVSLRSAASSPASRIASPMPEESENLYEFELGGSESPEAAALEEAMDGHEDEDADADVEDLELPSPAQTQTQKSSSSNRKTNPSQQPRGQAEATFDEDINEDDEDDLEKQLELAMAGDDEEEVSEEE